MAAAPFAPALCPIAMPTSRRLIRFLIVATLLYVAWYFLYYYVLLPDGRIDHVLTFQIADTSAALLRLFGVNATIDPPPAPYALLRISGVPTVIVGVQCDGLALYVLFAGFILAYPGDWRAKLWFIPAGIAAIYVVNLIRVAALALNHHYSPGTMQFNHHYTFTILVYAFIFWLWTIWVRRYSNPHRPAGGTTADASLSPLAANAA